MDDDLVTVMMRDGTHGEHTITRLHGEDAVYLVGISMELDIFRLAAIYLRDCAEFFQAMAKEDADYTQEMADAIWQALEVLRRDERHSLKMPDYYYNRSDKELAGKQVRPDLTQTNQTR